MRIVLKGSRVGNREEREREGERSHNLCRMTVLVPGPDGAEIKVGASIELADGSRKAQTTHS